MPVRHQNSDFWAAKEKILEPWDWHQNNAWTWLLFPLIMNTSIFRIWYKALHCGGGGSPWIYSFSRIWRRHLARTNAQESIYCSAWNKHFWSKLSACPTLGCCRTKIDVSGWSCRHICWTITLGFVGSEDPHWRRCKFPLPFHCGLGLRWTKRFNKEVSRNIYSLFLDSQSADENT